jgi:heme-degrading monooxygenase HmoA
MVRAMIVRIWRGQAERENAPTYLRHVTERVFPTLNGIPGHVGSSVLQRDADTCTEFLVMTYWDSWDAIRAFAGGDIDAAVVEPEAREALSEFDEFVRHVEVVQSSNDPRAAAP